MKSSRIICRAVMVALAVAAVAGCALFKKPAPAPVAPARVDAAGLLAEVRVRGDRVKRYDAVVEADLEGAPVGRLFGGIQIEDAGSEGLAVRLQAYTLTGMPVMELVARGPRFELFSPLEQRTYLNFTGAPGADPADDFPLELFNETTLPVGLLLEQFGIFWGRGIGDAELAETDAGYILYERAGGELTRETEWDRSLRLVRVKLFTEGSVYGGMECSDYKGSGPESVLPSRIELYQGGVRLKLALSRVRVNGDVSGPAIAFRPPAAGRVILLTPPLSPPATPIAAPPAPPEPTPAAGGTAASAVAPGDTVAPAPLAPVVSGGSTAAPLEENLAPADATTAPAPAPEPAPEPPASGDTAAPSPPPPSPGAPAPVMPD